MKPQHEHKFVAAACAWLSFHAIAMAYTIASKFAAYKLRGNTMDIVKGNLGTAGNYGVAFSGGKLVSQASLSESKVEGPLAISASFGVNIGLDAIAVLNALEAKYPNLFVKEVLEIAKTELGSIA